MGHHQGLGTNKHKILVQIYSNEQHLINVSLYIMICTSQKELCRQKMSLLFAKIFAKETRS